MVNLTLLGGFDIRRSDGGAIEVPGQKDRALLAILGIEPGQTFTRDKLASLLWSDHGERQARDSLKHALTRLRRYFRTASPTTVIADRQSVRLDPAMVCSDVASFEELVAKGTRQSFEQATSLYRGELLEGIKIRGSAFEEWLLFERQRLHRLAEEALTELLTLIVASGDFESISDTARNLISMDPLNEQAYRAMMMAHAACAQVPQALKLYDILCDGLRREFGVMPAQETEQLAERIRGGNRIFGSPSVQLSPVNVDGSDVLQVALPLPSNPSIAVLAFENLSGDPEQEYFADGIVEEIITELSRFRNLFVIARNSSFAYKGRSVDAKQIGGELGVRYILEGSVRKSAGRVRILCRLVDTASGTHLWADRFEAQLEDIFDLQDQVTESVIGAIGPKLEQAEIKRAKRKPTENLDAYDYFLRGLAAAHRWTRGANDEALQMFYKAIELDPDFASAYGMAARCYSQRKACGWVTDHAADNAEVQRLARKASGLGMDDAVALSTAGIGLAFVTGDIDGGCIWIDRALALNPNLAIAWLYSGWVNIWIGLPDIAIERLSHAIRLSPQDPEIAMMQGATACAHFFAGRIDDAIFWAEQSLRLQPNYLIATSMLAASYAIAGRSREAEDAVERVRQVDPNCRISKLLDSFPFRRKDDFNRWSEGLRKAGLPE